MYSGASEHERPAKTAPMLLSPFGPSPARTPTRLSLTVVIAAALLFSSGVSAIALAQSAAPAAQPTQNAQEQMSVRLGTHDGYTRLVFDFPTLTAYALSQDASEAAIVFTTPLSPPAVPRASGQLTSISSMRPTADTLAVKLGLAPGATVKHYRLMRKIVVDVFPPENKPAQTAQAKPAAKPAAKPVVEKKPTPPPAPTVAKVEDKAPAPVVTPVAETPPQLALPADPALKVDVPPPSVAPAPDIKVEPTTISLSTVEPSKLAVFTRYGTLWVVMDGKAASASDPTILGPDAGFLGKPKQLTFEGGRAYRYSMPANREVTISRKSLMWEITLGRDLREVPQDTTLTVSHDDATAKSKLLVDLKDPGAVLSFEDPSVGDTLIVVPAASPQSRIESNYRYANVEIIGAETGLVVRPLADDVRVNRLGNFITVSADSGIAATPGASATPTMIDNSTSFNSSETKRLFDFPNWVQGGLARLNDNRRVIEAQVAGASTVDAKQEEALKLALLYFANGFGHEALGILRMLMTDDPEMEKNPNIIALRGASAALAGHYDEAMADLTNPAIQQHPEISLWIGYVAAASEQWRRADQAFPRTNELLAEYPAGIAIPMTIYMAESALRLGHADSAQQLLDTLNTLPVKDYPHFEAAIGYLRGEAARQNGKFAEAIALWRPVADGMDRLYHTKAALALTLLELQEKKITLKEAVEHIDSLRFAWRGDGLEVQTLTALGRTKILNGQFLEGLNDLRAAAEFADQLRDDSTPIRQEMAQTVTTLFSGSARDKLNPLEAVSIYSEYEGLLPEGAAGSTAVLNFADYLTRMDLLDRAAGLINRVLDDTSDQPQRAEISTRLAAIYLLDGKPALALETINRTVEDAATADADLQQRRTLLKARAQSQLNLTSDAIATLAPLKTTEARRLTADVLWRARRWREAAGAIETLLPATPPAKLNDDTARLVMNAAVGYKLAGDSEGLAALRRNYASQMAATTFGPTFTVVTRDGGSASLSDRDTILRIAGEVDMFKSLLDSYKAATATQQSSAAGSTTAAPAPAQSETP